MSQPQISRDLEEIDKIICPQDATERTKRRVRLLSKMRHAEKELWDAWERSKQDKETSTKEKVLLAGNASGHAGKGGKTAKNANERNKASIKSEGRLPNSNYMGQLNKLWDREAKLLGMNEPETHDILVKQVQFIEIVRPAPKQPTTPPTLTTPTTLTPPPPIPPVLVTDAAPTPASNDAPPAAVVGPAPATTDVAPQDSGKLRIEANRPKEVK